MTMTTAPLPAGTFLAAACLHTPLMVTREGREYRLPQTIPYSYKNEQGDVVETQAIVFSVDNGNDAFKGCVLDAHEPRLCAQRIVTAASKSTSFREAPRQCRLQ